MRYLYIGYNDGLSLKEWGQSVKVRNLFYPFLRGQPLKFSPTWLVCGKCLSCWLVCCCCCCCGCCCCGCCCCGCCCVICVCPNCKCCLRRGFCDRNCIACCKVDCCCCCCWCCTCFCLITCWRIMCFWVCNGVVQCVWWGSEFCEVCEASMDRRSVNGFCIPVEFANLGINRNPFNSNNKSQAWLNFFQKKRLRRIWESDFEEPALETETAWSSG